MLLVSFFSFLIVCILFLHECLIFLPFGIVENFLLLITLVSHMVWCHFQVALQLLSEREKNDLSQLVSTMVSYSITYKNVNSDPLSINPRHEATSDASSISFDPPINDFINFKVWVDYSLLRVIYLWISELLSTYLFLTMKQGYSCGHFILTSAMKQVVLHEVSHVYCCRLVGLFINILVFFFFFLVLNSFMQLLYYD